MPLQCVFKACHLADFSQIVFYQDLTTGGWNLALGPQYVIPGSTIPTSIHLFGTGKANFPYDVYCAKCKSKVGIVNLISGFERMTINFSAKNVRLLDSNCGSPAKKKVKWSQLIDAFPNIRRITATIPDNSSPVALETVHFHGVSDLEDIIGAGTAVSSKSNLSPKDYQWRGLCFACFNNVLLCLPTGMGKTLIANMLMVAYRKRNIGKGQVFIVPTVLLVEQQASVTEQNTGLKVIRRSGDEFKRITWLPDEICVCTPAMLLNALKLNQIEMSQIALLIFDEVHEANSPNSPYGQLLPYITQCPASKRPRVLGLTASPCSNSSDMHQSISALCTKLGAVAYTPLLEDSVEKPNSITCNYVSIQKTAFEMEYDKFVINALNTLAHLHDFFKANWKIYPKNVDVHVKISAIWKVISQARLVGKEETDIPLLQLTNWMLKWLDSVNILQVLGPMRLVQLIRADLDYAAKDQALSKLSAQLAPVINQLRDFAEEIFTKHELDNNSLKLVRLLSLVEQHHQSHELDRILIFVERRDTAERLCRRLREEPFISEMNPISVMGNANGGSASKDVQQHVMETFRSGQCQLLVATSVLEQGIDVAMCGLVICFDGVKSVKSIIQSRGRARKDGANFVAFVAADKWRKANELNQMEVSMDYTIRQLMRENESNLDRSISEALDTFLASVDRHSEEDYSILDESDDDDDELDDDQAADRTTIRLRFLHFISSRALIEHMQYLDRVKVTKRFIDAYFTVSDDGNLSKIIKTISTSSPGNASRLRSWIEVSENDRHFPENDSQLEPVIFDSLTGIFFQDFTTVAFDRNHIWSGVLIELHVRSNELEICTSNLHFHIHATNVETILIEDTENSFGIYLCLRHPPAYFIDEELTHFDFATRSFNLCLQRTTSVDCTTAMRLRDAFHSFTLNIFNVCHLVKSTAENSSRCMTEPANAQFMTDYLIKVWHSAHSASLPTILPKRILERFYECSSLTTLKLFLNNTTPVRFQKLRLGSAKDLRLPFIDGQNYASDYVSLGRVNVTPTRFIYLPMQPVQQNRVYRCYPDPENFLLISFTDENGGNPWRSTNVCEWFLAVLREGIQIGTKTFTFLGCSNSQLREGRCWFSTLNRDEVYAAIGDFPEHWSAGRKLTRLALAFASSFQTVALNHERFLRNVADDVEVNGVNFSDGIGRASHNLVEKLQTAMNLAEKPSAFQIRIGGIKGVVSVFHQDDDVTFRKSMKKFESNHNILEVLNYSRSLPLSLNRHVILLLSNYGISDDTFLDMQHKQLVKCVDTLVDEKASLSFVQSHSSIFDWELFAADRLVQEPFFVQMLISNAVDLIAGVTNHSHIPVQKGRILMGVLDETGTLEYGEVYAHIVESDFDYEIEGRVLVFRNPCVLPSDIRVLNARKSSSSVLKDLYRNCLVLPSKGPNSHANECSGGDLDGDLYYVIWDEDLIPELPVPGEEVVEVKTKQSALQICNSNESMMQFYCDYLSKNQLGIIANAHLSAADQFNMRDERTIELAKYVAAETDAPKKGYTVGKIPKKLLPIKYPDFMQKSDRPSYPSQTILGELFRQSKPILEVFLEKRLYNISHLKYSITGDDNEMSIENCYAAYSYEIKAMLQSFDLDSEVDLFSGTPIWKNDYLSTFKQQHQMRQNVSGVVGVYWRKWKGIFDKWRSVNGNDQSKILQWYNRPKSSPWPINSFSFLAMPFVHFDACIRTSISQKIYESTHRWIIYNKMRWLTEWHRRYNIFETVTARLDGIECHSYGSSALGLNEDYSDVDLYVRDTNFDNVSRALQALDRNVHIMRRPHACVALTHDSLKIEITNFIGGVQKTNTLAKTFDENPGYWAALKVLVEWARIARIVKSGGSEGLMTVVSFCHLFISFVTDSPVRMRVEEMPSHSLKRFGNWIDSFRDSACGTLIYDFLKRVSARDNRVWLMTKTDPLSKEPLIKRDLIDELRKNAEIALCILSVHNGDVCKLFEFCTKQRLFRLDKRYIEPTTANETTRNLCLKELGTVCNPTKDKNLHFKLTERNGIYYLEVSGDHKLFADVEKGINRIHCRIMNARVKDVCRTKTYHVKNSTIILPEFGYGLLSNVSFSTYAGDRYHIHHMGIWKSRLMLRNVDRNVDWREMEYQRYESRFLQQMDLYTEKQRTARKSSRCVRFFGKLYCRIRCGSHYFFHIPEALHNTFETISLENIEQKVAHMVECLDLERQENVIQDIKNYNASTLMQSSHRRTDDSLVLMPLHELKVRRVQQKNENLQFMSASKNKNLNGIRHSFYTMWNVAFSETKEFAAQNGFNEVPTDSTDHYTNLTVFWRQRELTVSCDRFGRITEINHRKARWFSATISKMEENCGHDVRFYLESQSPLDDDESSLKTVIEYLNQRSIFTETFAQQLGQDMAKASFPSRPLIPDIFHFNWRFRSMRVSVPILKFINAENDECVLNEIYDGFFHVDKHEFEWFPKHFEFEVRLSMDNISPLQLCKKSYHLGLKLFDHSKLSLQST